MRIKVGNKWYSGEDEAIMVELTDIDKENIANMLPQCAKYCSYTSAYTEDEINTFMELTPERIDLVDKESTITGKYDK